MDKTISGILVLALIALFFVLMWAGWRARTRRQQMLAAPHPLPNDVAGDAAIIDVMYVATTKADEPLNRVAVGGLGFRARAKIVVRTTGLWLQIPGQNDVFIPAHSIRTVETARWTIDRVVEDEGLLVIAWSLANGDPVDSFVRVIDPRAQTTLIESIEAIIVTETITESVEK